MMKCVRGVDGVRVRGSFPTRTTVLLQPPLASGLRPRPLRHHRGRYVGIFTKSGKELYRSQMIAGYSPAVTGMRRGADGYAIERNTRYTDHKGGNKEMFSHLLSGRPLNGWTVRQTLQKCAACAVSRYSRYLRYLHYIRCVTYVTLRTLCALQARAVSQYTLRTLRM